LFGFCFVIIVIKLSSYSIINGRFDFSVICVCVIIIVDKYGYDLVYNYY